MLCVVHYTNIKHALYDVKNALQNDFRLRITMGYKPRDDNGFYNGNPLVKAAGAKHEFTLDEIQQLKKCINDPAYFINNFVKITSIDKGVVLFKLHPYQKRIIDTINQNRFTICKLFRQAG